MIQSQPRCSQTDDRGITIVIMAISLVSLCAIGGLAIDGGAAYSNRRQTQNASDSASLAGTIVLDGIRTGDEDDESAILAAVTAKLGDNDADVANFTCQIVPYDASGTGYGSPYPCPTSDLAPGTFDIADAAGVQVNANKTHETSLMRVVGIESVTSRAEATATIQSARGLERSAAPFMLCGAGVADDGFLIPLLTAIGGNYGINPNALYRNPYTGVQSGTDLGRPADLPGGPWYLIHDDNGGGADNGNGTGVPGCGMGGAGFKGLVNTNLSYTIPGFWDTKTGQVEGPTESVLRGSDGCIGSLDACYIVVPIGAYGEGNGTNGELFNVRFGMFFLVEVGGGNGSHYVALMEPGSINPITAEAVPDFVLAGGVGGGRVVDETQPYFIKLSE
ncbi:MAG: pilus assembly protein TadG-related protein [Acidimicrobiales bacterium]